MDITQQRLQQLLEALEAIAMWWQDQDYVNHKYVGRMFHIALPFTETFHMQSMHELMVKWHEIFHTQELMEVDHTEQI